MKMNKGSVSPQNGLSPVSRGILTAAGLVVIVAGMKASASLVLPILVSGFLALICAPALFWLKGKGFPTGLAVLAVVVVLLGAFSLVGVLIGSSFNEFYRALPTYHQGLELQLLEFRSWLESFGITLPRELLGPAFSPGPVMQLAATVLSSFGTLVTSTFVILLTVVFMLLEASTFSVKLGAIVARPDLSFAKFDIIARNVNRYLAIKTLVSVATGVTAGIWLAILGVDFAVLWGILAFLLNYIPNIGSIIAAVPPAMLALVQLGPGSALLVLAGYAVINGVLGNVVEPRVLGQGLGLSTLVVFVSLLVWQWVFGPVGMLLSVPLTMTLKIALESNSETRWVAVVLGSGREVANLSAGGDENESQETRGEA
jgi:predicted PurR-regulated permease PerM